MKKRILKYTITILVAVLMLSSLYGSTDKKIDPERESVIIDILKSTFEYKNYVDSLPEGHSEPLVYIEDIIVATTTTQKCVWQAQAVRVECSHCRQGKDEPWQRSRQKTRNKSHPKSKYRQARLSVR